MSNRKHGGKRDGAGRKPLNSEGRTKLVSVTVPIELIKELDHYAEVKGWSRSQAVTSAIRCLLKQIDGGE